MNQSQASVTNCPKSEEQTDLCYKTPYLFMQLAVFVFAVEIIHSWGTQRILKNIYLSIHHSIFTSIKSTIFRAPSEPLNTL